MALRSDGVVVITSASHAEGREFEPRSDLFVIYKNDWLEILFGFYSSFFQKQKIYKILQSFKTYNIQIFSFK